jgi:hypothetical protein
MSFEGVLQFQLSRLFYPRRKNKERRTRRSTVQADWAIKLLLQMHVVYLSLMPDEQSWPSISFISHMGNNNYCVLIGAMVKLQWSLARSAFFPAIATPSKIAGHLLVLGKAKGYTRTILI